MEPVVAAATGCAVPAVATARHFAAEPPAAVGWRWHFAGEQPRLLGSAASVVSAATPAVATVGSAVAAAVIGPTAGYAVARLLEAASSFRWPRSLSAH